MIMMLTGFYEMVMNEVSANIADNFQRRMHGPARRQGDVFKLVDLIHPGAEDVHGRHARAVPLARAEAGAVQVHLPRVGLPFDCVG